MAIPASSRAATSSSAATTATNPPTASHCARDMQKVYPIASARDAPVSRERNAMLGRDRRAIPSGYLIWSYSLNMGMYIAMTTKPTIPPTTTSMTGSRIDVSDLTAAAT